MNSYKKLFAVCLLSALCQAAYAAQGSLSDFAVLSAAPNQGGAVTCTDSTVNGDVGSTGLPASIVQTRCTINGATVAPVSSNVTAKFDTTLASLMALPCTQTLTTLAGQTLSPGTYCFDAASTTTDGVLTLTGNGSWIFKIGTLGTGALTGTNFQVVGPNGTKVACENVIWAVAQAATLTTSQFVGTIYAGAAITVTGGTYSGDAISRAAVTLTGTTLDGCATGSTPPPPPPAKQKCNQGVGNGPEACDPGNSNQGNPLRSNDEQGGIPGKPGRQGGNKK